MIDPRLTDKVALITGANNPHGIGTAIALALAAQGVRIFATYKRLHETDTPTDEPPEGGMARYKYGRAQDASYLETAVSKLGGTIVTQEANLSNAQAVPALFDAAEAAFGQVDIVVNNAAHWEPTTFLPDKSHLTNDFSVSWLDNEVPTFEPDAHDRTFAVNARGVAQMMTEFARRHIQRNAEWGRIINLSTDAAYSFPSEVTYGASKLATESYSRSAASELGQFGITVNIISPGPIQTGYITPEMETSIAAHTPLRRVGTPQDVADVVVFLCSEQGRWLTGQCLYVGGGHRM